MPYLFLLFYSVFYLYLVESINSKKRFSWLVAVAPVGVLYFSIPALQYGIGTDYFSYINIVELGYSPGIEKSGEFFFLYLIKILNHLDVNPQLFFVITAFLQASLIFYLFSILRSSGYLSYVLFFIFFTVTGIYHNQMNGVRQSLAILLVPFVLILFYDRKYVKGVVVLFLGLMFHKSFFIVGAVIPVFLCANKLFRKAGSKLFLFIASPLIVYFLFKFAFEYLLINVFDQYAHYLDSNIEVGWINIATKVYYTPIFLLFWLYYVRDGGFLAAKYFNFFITVFSITHALYLTDLVFPFYGRVFQYFVFFYIFPVYFLVFRLAKLKDFFSVFLVFLYCLAPYCFKVIFSVAEYKFDTILFKGF